MSPLVQGLVVALGGSLAFAAYPGGERLLARLHPTRSAAAEEQAPRVGPGRPSTVGAGVGSAAADPEPSPRRDLLVAALIGGWLCLFIFLLAVLP